MYDKLDKLANEVGGRVGLLLAEIDGRFGKLYVMFGVIVVGLAIPVIQSLASWLAGAACTSRQRP